MAAEGEAGFAAVPVPPPDNSALAGRGASEALQLSRAARKAQPSDLVALAEHVEKVSESAFGHVQSADGSGPLGVSRMNPGET